MQKKVYFHVYDSTYMQGRHDGGSLKTPLASSGLAGALTLGFFSSGREMASS